MPTSSGSLDEAAVRAGDRLRYTYDFGDDWEHDIVTETITGAQPGTPYPRCLAGRRACPPEDCGGMWGYERLLAILADPGNEEHDEQVECLGLESAGSLDPGAFDLAGVNRALSSLVGLGRQATQWAAVRAGSADLSSGGHGLTRGTGPAGTV